MAIRWLRQGCVVGFGAVAAVSAAQTSGSQPNTYGTSSLVSYTMNAWAFQEQDTVPNLIVAPNGGRYAASGSVSAIAPVFLPSGAVIDHMELEACDGSVAFDVSARLNRCSTAGCNLLSLISTSGALGCARITGTPTSTVVVDNQTDVYIASFTIPASASNFTFNAYRIYYRLQVSPGPAVATFTDVPSSNPQYKFVEALVAAGITAGCGGGNYCPNSPITRGQMAVFLATALGLHFPN